MELAEGQNRIEPRGYKHQFEGGWKTVNVRPGERLVGRAVTAAFMPQRPDMNAVINDHAKKEGRIGTGQNSWVIDTLVKGDIVLSDPDGIVFIPAHLAEAVANESEMTRLRDDWGHKMLREQKYAPGQVDGQWTPQMIEEFNKYAEEKGSKVRMPAKR